MKKKINSCVEHGAKMSLLLPVSQLAGRSLHSMLLCHVYIPKACWKVLKEGFSRLLEKSCCEIAGQEKHILREAIVSCKQDPVVSAGVVLVFAPVDRQLTLGKNCV